MDAATEMRSNGGKARAKSLSPARRREIARQAGNARADILTSEERRASAGVAARARWRQYYAENPDKLAAKQERERKKKRRKAA